MQFHIVAFIDILGFSQMVKLDATSDQSNFLTIFKDAIGEVRQTFGENDSLDVKMFSDSIVVGAPMTPDNLKRVLEACIDLQRRFLRRNVLVRGGISLGKHYSDEQVTFSAALVAAYEIESKLARFPRIVVDKNLLDYFENHPGTGEDLKANALSLMKRDRDGACFTHFLRHEDFEDSTAKLREMLAPQRSAEDTVLEKLRWLHDYHSYCASLFGKPSLDIDGLQISFHDVH